jgi:hypothetical protein
VRPRLGLGRGAAGGRDPEELIEKRLTVLVAGQQEDGGWPDPHGLIQWRPLHTIWSLKALRDQGAWQA